MAILVTTGPTTRHEKESLNDYIARIDPAECPFYSNLSSGTVKATKHEWTVQELTAASATNFATEGPDGTDSNGVVPTRLANAVSLSTKDGKVSGTYDRIETAGGSTETARQKMLKGLELRRDLEAILTANNVAVFANSPRELAGMPTWITNGSVGTTTGALSSGTGTTAVAAGTDRAFITIDYVDDSMQAAFEDGGNPRAMYMTPGLKKRFSKIPDAIAGGSGTTGASMNELQQTKAEPMVFVGAASAYLSDFGRLEVIPSRHMIAKTVLGIDPDHVRKLTTPGGSMASKDLSVVGDSKRFQIIWEGTLEADAPKAHWGIFALDPSLTS